MEKLAPYVLATHVKDLMPDKHARPTDWHFFAGVPVGDGLIDNETLAKLLHKAHFKGFLAVEIDHPHTDWTGKRRRSRRPEHQRAQAHCLVLN